ncbi:MAG: hypothetical protein ACTIDN_08940 [Acetobacter sp.]|uniref:hypothetical protein n=1 Tax=Acetobacter sp. TaxID=440 RepID=UPI003F8EE9FB
MTKPHIYTLKGWVGKSMAGVLMGFAVALAFSGILINQVFVSRSLVTVQLAMWVMPPLWLACLSVCFLFSTAYRAWFFMSTIALILFIAGYV